jgi:hypothetical protein
VGNIAPAAARLASHLTNTRSQELRKESGEALVELAENGPGIPLEVRPTLERAALDTMKHARQLAAFALAADALDRRDVARFAWLTTGHPRADVRLRALRYVARGAEWRDAVPLVPMLLEGLASAPDASARRPYLGAVFAVLTGPRDAGATPERAEAGSRTLRVLDALGLTDDAPEVADARRAAKHAATSMDRWTVAASWMASWMPTGERPSGWDATVAALGPMERRDLWALAHHVEAWPVLRAAMWHPDPSVRAGVLNDLSMIAIRSMRSMTPIVPSIRSCLDDADAQVRRAAISLFESLALFGSALDRTDLRAAEASLQASAASEGEDAIRAEAVLKVGQLLGGLRTS